NRRRAGYERESGWRAHQPGQKETPTLDGIVMMEPFDDLKRRWQAAPVPQTADGLADRIAKGHRRHLRQVRFMSACFLLVYVVLVWVWLSFPGRTWAFYAGLAGSGLLL